MLVDQLQDLGKEGLRLVLILGEVSVRRTLSGQIIQLTRQR